MKRAIYFILLLLIITTSCKKSASAPTVVYQDDLYVNENSWNLDSTSAYNKGFYKDHYSINVDTSGEMIVSMAPYGSINYPYSVQVDGTMQLINANQTGNIGFLFNYVDAKDFSLLQIFSNGTYAIWAMKSGTYSCIVSSTVSSAIQSGSGAKNTIKIIQGQSSMQLVINNTIIGNYPITFPGSYIQVGIYASDNTPNVYPFIGLFNNFIMARV